ncbi:MAG: hypothetical protein KAS93_03790 [Gammaproteobacteria bacterium]|nr:hypothetical protein [Gammaproteobacteria bacterium]
MMKFIDVNAQYVELKDDIDQRVADVLVGGKHIKESQVTENGAVEWY